MQSLFPSSDGTLIFAEAAGNKNLPAIVFVHGLSLSSLVWSGILQDTRLLEYFYLVAYDMRGHGRSGQPETMEGHASKLYADDFAAVCKGFGLVSPIFNGWSLGACVAADITAHLEQSAMSGIIWTNPMPYLDPATLATVVQPENLALLPGLSTEEDVVLSFEARLKFVDIAFNDPSRVREEVKWSWAGSSLLQKPRQVKLVTGRSQNPQGLFKAGENGLPLLLFTGGKDQHLKAQPEQDIAQKHFRDLTIHHIENGSHSLFYENRDEYVQEIIVFGKRVFGIKE